MILPIKDDNPTITRPWVTLSIVAINSIVFLYSYLLGTHGFDVFIQRMGLIPFEIIHAVDAVSPTSIPLYLTIFSAMFMHGGLMHLGGNLLYLWIFGNNVEESLGPFGFLCFYLLCGISATAAHVISSPNSMVPLVGASGAIAGVLGAYLAAFPGARVHVLVFLIFFIQIVRVPALLVLGGWFVIQVFSATTETSGGGSGVAWYAHIVGFIVGYFLMRRRVRRLATYFQGRWEA